MLIVNIMAYSQTAVVENCHMCSTYYNLVFGKLSKQMILTFLIATFVPPLASTPP